MNIVCVICCVSAAIFAAEAVCKSSLTAFEQAALDAHNTVRRLHEDTPDLCYGETGSDISFSAQAWAEENASNNMMKHSRISQYYNSSNPYGENLAYEGTTGTVRAEDAAYEYCTLGWYDQIVHWTFSSRSGSSVYGYFTQVVWKGSQQVNCGYAAYYHSQHNCSMIVCQYYPAGNNEGQYATNVLPLRENNSNDDNSDDNNSTDNTDDNSGDSAGFATFKTTVFAFVAAAVLRLLA